MNEHWKEIAEELGSYDVDEYGTRFPARRRKLIVVDGTFYDPGEHVDTEIACKRIADLEAEVARKDEALEFYAMVENWEADIGLTPNAIHDKGHLARSALEEEA
jgi:hypothetical protein